ncbi:MAG: hypothetical protein AAFX09_06655, partial [Pseudomonadota bacterium]
YSHDARGNVIDNARLQFTYDRSDQPTAISGAATGGFVYDAHNRRVKHPTVRSAPLIGSDTEHRPHRLRWPLARSCA